MFETANLVDNAAPRRRWAMPASLLLQSGVISTFVIVPLIFTEQLALARISDRFTLPPPTFLKPKPVELVAVRVAGTSAIASPGVRVFVFDPKGYRKPVSTEPDLTSVDQDQPVLLVGGGPPSPTFVATLGEGQVAAPPPPPAPARRAASQPETVRVRVGGKVQPPALLRQVQPVYPPLARQARVEGVVRLNAVLARDGTVVSLQVVSGHPLLVRAAVEAVQQWLYRPTTLNGDPVEVALQIDVNFTLSQR